MPTTTEEYEKVLTAFKERDPNGNGRADEIPLTGAINSWAMDCEDFLMSAFVYTDGQRFIHIENGKLIFTPNKPEWKDGLKYINRLYSKGLIDSQAFTNSQDTVRVLANKRDDPVLGAYAGGHNKMAPQEDGIWQLYRVVPPLKGPGGAQWTAYRPYAPHAGGFAITNKASDAVQKKAMQLANYFYTQEGTLEMGAGIRGKIGESYEYNGRQIPYQWDWAGPNDLGLNGEPAIYVKLASPPMDELTNYKWHTEFRFWHKDLFNGWAADQNILTNKGYERFLVVESDKYIPHVPKEVLPRSMYFDAEDAQLTAQLQVEIQNYVEQNTVAFITGQRDIDREWDSYVKGFDGLRLNEYLSALQKTYDKMK
jgi:putative aldouronate transport system substrate-binding protein